MGLYVGGAERWREELIAIRKALGLTQAQMAHDLDLSLRAYSDIENGVSKCRQIHLMAAERLALFRAYQAQDVGLLPFHVRRDAESLKAVL
jgi:transcriptional regulator with XRE-family HTH domain